ncbi:MAG: RHS repeat-associated core domain-containing protein, partial [Proteobacteria bacterium]|nr:RHS repeat-associated core domain-containing protein [Pseudomonadota bacterium]
HFNKLGLVNMKGRIYDAHMGRFLTPDPFVPEPGNSQSWNRYSYVGNNPLNYTDPSGYFWKWALAAGAWVGTVAACSVLEPGVLCYGAFALAVGATSYARSDGNEVRTFIPGTLGSGSTRSGAYPGEYLGHAPGYPMGSGEPSGVDGFTPAPRASEVPKGAQTLAASATETRRRIERLARKSIYSEAWMTDVAKGNFACGTYKCNKFVYDILVVAGADPGTPNFVRGPPSARQWADPQFNIPGWRVLGPGETPMGGDVVAQRIHYSDAGGHVAIVSSRRGPSGPGPTYIGTADRGIIRERPLGKTLARPGVQAGPLTYRRWTGGP